MIGRVTAHAHNRAGSLPLDVQAALVAPLYARTSSLLLGHLTGIGLAGVAVARIGGVWPAAFMAASVVLLGIRIGLLVSRRYRTATLLGVLGLGRPYQAVGLTWAAVSSGLSFACVVIGHDQVCSLLGMVLIVGTSGGIASRNAGTPRFAILQITTWLVPTALAAPLMLGPWYASLSLLMLLYFAALCSIVRQHYADLLALISAERGARAVAARFGAALNNMTQGLLMFDAAGVLQLANRRFCDMFVVAEAVLAPGLSASAFADVCAAAGAPCELTQVPDGIARGDTIRAVIDLADGRALATVYETLADGGRVVTIEDITPGRRAQQALADREAELQAMFDNAGAGVQEYDIASHRIVRINRAFCTMMGRSEAQLLGMVDPVELTHPDERRAHERRIADIARTGVAYDTEKRYQRPDGSVVWCRLNVSISTKDAHGRPARLLSIVQDISERKAAEVALRASEEVTRLSLDIGRIGSFRRDLRAGTIHCGHETRLMHGFPQDDTPLPAADWLAMVLPDDRARLIAKMQHTYAERRSIANFDYRFHHPVGGIRHIEARARIEYDKAGVPVSSIGVAIDVTERRAAEALVAQLAHHDPLTGLANRSLFRVRLDAALVRAAGGKAFALCCLDLDHFKYVNDTLGHSAGDALLQAVTARLQHVVRPRDTVARLGGDEFAIIQADLDQVSDAAGLADRLLEAIAAPFDIGGQRVVIATSIGISVAPDDGLDAELLLRNADMALYAAKADGRGRMRFFEREMDLRMQARRALEVDLRCAMEGDQFDMFYQPLICIANGAVRGFEALLRWRHPTRGMVPPDRFIPLAEAIGLIVPIGEWALRRACRDAVAWPGERRVAVNISAVQFASNTLVESVAAALRESGLDPARLELEITESAMLTDTEANLATLHRLRGLGARIAMDDFGTGYSSLSYLLRFPFDKVKIDRAFIANLGQSRESAAIVGSVIGLCTSLEMSTTAEGVESAGQLLELARIGCSEAQGFYFSNARPTAEVPALIQRLEHDAKALMSAPT